ncbi:jg21563 [Pararge aegeria aegeria]|uniref:Jg21563 protein n=1 Tax=Pararge aegeria aegeria TaxID=348720 RepID=A0A8S4RPL4_9NEOP|nr:jg21563 [Pararge aegeria aegeria]
MWCERRNEVNGASGALAAGTIASPWSTAAGAPDTNGSGGADAKHLDVGEASDDEKVSTTHINMGKKYIVGHTTISNKLHYTTLSNTKESPKAHLEHMVRLPSRDKSAAYPNIFI